MRSTLVTIARFPILEWVSALALVEEDVAPATNEVELLPAQISGKLHGRPAWNRNAVPAHVHRAPIAVAHLPFVAHPHTPLHRGIRLWEEPWVFSSLRFAMSILQGAT